MAVIEGHCKSHLVRDINTGVLQYPSATRGNNLFPRKKDQQHHSGVYSHKIRYTMWSSCIFVVFNILLRLYSYQIKIKMFIAYNFCSVMTQVCQSTCRLARVERCGFEPATVFWLLSSACVLSVRWLSFNLREFSQLLYEEHHLPPPPTTLKSDEEVWSGRLINSLFNQY